MGIERFMVKQRENRLRGTIDAIDARNREDPHTVTEHGVERPWEMVHAEAMTRWVEKLDPNASEELLIAARAQHICRWEIPRETYPKTRQGYHRWRNDLKEYHARLTGDIMAVMGYEFDAIQKVQRLNRKEGLLRADKDLDVQTIEDALSLTFLEYRLESFARRDEHSDEKLVRILHKTMRKMSARAIEHAQSLSLEPRVQGLVHQAIDQLSQRREK